MMQMACGIFVVSPSRRLFLILFCIVETRDSIPPKLVKLLRVPGIPPAPAPAPAAGKQGHDGSEAEQGGGAQEGPHPWAELGASAGGGGLVEAGADHVEDDIVDDEGGQGGTQGQQGHKSGGAAAGAAGAERQQGGEGRRAGRDGRDGLDHGRGYVCDDEEGNGAQEEEGANLVASGGHDERL
ncbi:hypothetical protein PspLS_08875 [Pyricularia sp. CBS 133598]|nr:hypothetical protein PspLS_08875 [Pyricularia sp. CBS 133598]